MDYLSLANSNILYVVTIVLLGIVFAQAIIYLKMAFQRAKDIGIPMSKMKTAARTAAITTVVPSIAVIIALFALAPVLGLPFSWARLSVIGSMSYELMAAEVGANAAGSALNAANYGPQAFLASAWAMTLGSAPQLFVTAVFYKKYKESVMKGVKSKGDKNFTRVILASLMLGLYATFVMPPVLKGGTGTYTVFVSAITMVGLGFIIKKFKFKWLTDFSLSIAMLVGMAAAVVISV